MYINAIEYVYIREESIMPTDKTDKKMYFHLFNAITDAMKALGTHDNSDAAQTLIAARQWGEDAYLEIPDEDA